MDGSDSVNSGELGLWRSNDCDLVPVRTNSAIT